MRKKVTPKITLKCVFCKDVVKADNTIKAVLCSRCTARLSGSPMEIGKFPKSDSIKTEKKSRKRKVRKVKTKRIVRNKNVVKTKPVSKTAGWGRGWHLKKKFIAPTGDVYKFGQLFKKKAGSAGSN